MHVYGTIKSHKHNVENVDSKLKKSMEKNQSLLRNN